MSRIPNEEYQDQRKNDETSAMWGIARRRVVNMIFFKRIKVRSYEMGLYFRDKEFMRLLAPGTHWVVAPLFTSHVEVVSQRQPWLAHEKLDMIVKSGLLKDRAVVLDLKDYERALVWIDGRFSHVL